MTKRILIIDDDRELSGEISETLKHEGFSVDAAYDGIKGGELAKKSSYDIILLDVKLPGLNGIDLLRDIKSKKSESKIFLVSGDPFLEKLAEKENLSGLIYSLIGKPFDIEKLIAQIKLI